VFVTMQDGQMTASFQTSNDDATRLLSHSLAQLKHVLESQGVSVDKLQVQQSPRDQQASNQDGDGRQQHHHHGDESARHEQQRKEMLRRMWRRLSDGSDPLDLVA
jgi:flagellar hook-length control protein FliK